VKNSTSDLLIANCDEFIYYDDLVREQKKRGARKTTKAAAKTAPAVAETKASSNGGTARPAKAPARGRKRAAKTAEPDADQPAVVEVAPSRVAEVLELPAVRSDEDKVHEALDLIVGTIEALSGERAGDKVWGSMVKQALKRVKPGFNESYYGFRSFNAMLEEAQARGLVALERDDKSGGYAVRLAAAAD
jgi:hypothetical protein